MENKNSVYSFAHQNAEVLFMFDNTLNTVLLSINKEYREYLINSGKSIWQKDIRNIDCPRSINFPAKEIKMLSLPDYIPEEIQKKIIKAFNESCVSVGMTTV